MDLKTALKKTDGVAKYTGHGNVALAALHKMRQNMQMTDVALKVDNGCIPAHKVILSSTSPYFYAMFNDDMVEKQLSEILLHDIDIKTLKLLVDYLYTGEIEITEDNVESLLSASSMLQIWPVREGCSEFLQLRIHPLNCFGIWRFADTHGLTDLKDKSLKFLLHNFQQAVNSEEFLLLSFSELKKIISNNQLYVDSEEKVFLAVLNWVKHCEPDRVQHMAELLCHVRLPLISSDILMSTVDSEVLVRDNAECVLLVYEAVKYHLSLDQRIASFSERTSLRRPEGSEQYVFAIGGRCNGNARTNEGEAYNPRTDTWFSVAPMKFSREMFGVSVVGRKLYVIGGKHEGSSVASCECYSPETNTWSNIASMGSQRSGLGVCSLHGFLYACGGYGKDSCLHSVEKYDPYIGVWITCPQMSTRKNSFGVATIDNCVYTLGGYDGKCALSIVERLDPREGKWSILPEMRSARRCFSAAAVNSELYCIGGMCSNVAVASGERFDIRNNQWEEIEPMHSARAEHQVVNCGDGLIALGGSSASHLTDSVERYDSKLNQWTEMAPMMKKRKYFGATSLECLNLEHVVSRKSSSSQEL